MRTSPRNPPGPRAAFTMVELMIGSLLMTTLLLVAGLATDRTLELLRQRRATDAVSSGANRLLQRLAGEFAFARRSSLVPTPPLSEGVSSLSFRKCLGVQGGVVNWTPIITIAWELEDGELEDGLDNNGNGLVDEGQLVWTQDPGQPDELRVVWGHGLCALLPGETLDGDDEDGDGLIDERGLCFSITDDLLTIRVGLQGRGTNATTITKVVETSVLLRN